LGKSLYGAAESGHKNGLIFFIKKEIEIMEGAALGGRKDLVEFFIAEGRLIGTPE
jgi:hypothetical protein